MSVRRPSRIATLLHQLTLATQARRQEPPSVAPEAESGDADFDGVPDATEAFLGTSTHTDETQVGRGDDGRAERPSSRVADADGYVRELNREPISTSAILRNGSSDTGIRQDNALSLRLAILQQS